MVMYKKRYCDKSGKPMTISFNLCKSVSVNAIIGLPTLKEWKMVLDVDSGIATSKLLGREFKMSLQHAASGFPAEVLFNRTDFVHPRRQTTTGLALLCADSTAVPPSLLKISPWVLFKILRNSYLSKRLCARLRSLLRFSALRWSANTPLSTMLITT